MKHNAYLGLGTNLGDREENIRRAIILIGEQTGTVEARSALFYSEPWGFESEHGFVNAVVRISTNLSPHRLLKATQRIERQLGKTACHATERPSPPPTSAPPLRPMADPPLCPMADPPLRPMADPPLRPMADPPLCPMVLPAGTAATYHDRPIDIDILLYDDLSIDTPTLKIPHPLMQQRPFVMIPLQEVRQS